MGLLQSLTALLTIDDVPLLLSWTFALYMVIGATFHLKYRDLKKGLFILISYFFSYALINERVFSQTAYGTVNNISLILQTIILIITVTGIGAGKLLNSQIVKIKKLPEEEL